MVSRCGDFSPARSDPTLQNPRKKVTRPGLYSATTSRRHTKRRPPTVTPAARPGDPAQGAAERRARVRDHPPDVRDAGLQLRAPPGRRSLARRGPDAGGVPARLPGTAPVLAPVEVHDMALPGDQEPRARRAPRGRAA